MICDLLLCSSFLRVNLQLIRAERQKPKPNRKRKAPKKMKSTRRSTPRISTRNQHQPHHFSLVRSLYISDVLSIGNGASGLLAIFQVIEYLLTNNTDFLINAFWLNVLSIVFDAVDGKVARYRGVSTLFGQQLDSLSDLVSFAVFPSVLAFGVGCRTVLDQLAVIVFFCCALSRLARFNVTSPTVSKAYFEGFPTPTSFGLVAFIAGLVKYGLIGDDKLIWGSIGEGYFRIHFLALIYAFWGLLMISKTIKIPKM